MLEKIIGLTNSAYWWVLVFAFGCFAGWYVTSNHYKAVQAEAELNAAIARADQGKKAYVRIIEAQNGLDAWRASAESMSAELERVRSAKRTVRTSADTCGVERAAVARCEGLLERSADAVARCSDLLQRDAAIHDSVVGALK